ncbi:hypothetical protein RJ55_02736 [Drechmeria coniospora]|nr:hypothetical protein RJ55_02736 [Drechmeria coniospora]
MLRALAESSVSTLCKDSCTAKSLLVRRRGCRCSVPTAFGEAPVSGTCDPADHNQDEVSPPKAATRALRPPDPAPPARHEAARGQRSLRTSPRRTSGRVDAIATMNGGEPTEGQNPPLAPATGADGGDGLAARKRKKDGLKPIVTTDADDEDPAARAGPKAKPGSPSPEAQAQKPKPVEPTVWKEDKSSSLWPRCLRRRRAACHWWPSCAVARHLVPEVEADPRPVGPCPVLLARLTTLGR